MRNSDRTGASERRVEESNLDVRTLSVLRISKEPVIGLWALCRWLTMERGYPLNRNFTNREALNTSLERIVRFPQSNRGSSHARQYFGMSTSEYIRSHKESQ
jgi:hypothetical protein